MKKRQTKPIPIGRHEPPLIDFAPEYDPDWARITEEDHAADPKTYNQFRQAVRGPGGDEVAVHSCRNCMSFGSCPMWVYFHADEETGLANHCSYILYRDRYHNRPDELARCMTPGYAKALERIARENVEMNQPKLGHEAFARQYVEQTNMPPIKRLKSRLLP